MEGDQDTSGGFTLVTRKPCFGLPTACPNCLPAYIYLKLAQLPFQLAFNSTFPDSDELPYFETGTYVAYNNEEGGVIEKLKKDGGVSAWKIYYSDLPWVISKVLFYKQTYMAKTRLGIIKENSEEREKQETSVLRTKLLEHGNLVRYAEKLKLEFLEAPSSSWSPPLHSFPSSFSRKGSKPKSKSKTEKTEEEKKFKKRAKFFLAAQFLAVVIYLSVMGGVSNDELEYEDDE
uniref:Thioredoxin-like fold domain-containing protein n=1 Tax=Brassica campestris TaxID=3711 RepID=M4FCL9_BRACM